MFIFFWIGISRKVQSHVVALVILMKNVSICPFFDRKYICQVSIADFVQHLVQFGHIGHKKWSTETDAIHTYTSTRN